MRIKSDSICSSISRFAASAILLPGLILSLVACGSNESGNYRAGEDDPALDVTSEDIAVVDKTIERSMSEARGAGLLDPQSSAAGPTTELPADHPVISTMPAAAQQAISATSEDRVIKLREYVVTLPKGWESVPPESSMRLAQIQIPHPELIGENTVGELTAFYFGESAGSVQANIDRWVEQFTQPDGSSSAEKAKVDQMMAGARQAVLIDVSGTMLATAMPGVPPKPEQPNSRMLAAIVMSEEGPYFFKATGPEETMGLNRDKMVEFVQSFTGSGAGDSTMSATSDAPTTATVETAATPAATPQEAMPAEAPAAAPAVASGEGTPIEIQSVKAMLPAGWVNLPPSSSMRLAEIGISPTEGQAEQGVMTVFYFGPSAGSIDMNIDRWYGQFTQPDGRASSEVATRESLRTNSGMDIAFIDLTGTMLPSNMPGAPVTPEQPDWQLLGAIVLTTEGPYFFKATGPKSTMSQNRAKMVEFLQSIEMK